MNKEILGEKNRGFSVLTARLRIHASSLYSKSIGEVSNEKNPNR